MASTTSTDGGKGAGYLGAAALGIESIGTLGSTVSNYYAAKAAKVYQQAIAESNAKISAYKIKDATDRGDATASAYLEKVDKLRGSQKTALATQGIDIGGGSAYQALLDTTTQGNLDAITIRNNAAREAFGFKVEAINNTASSRLSQIGLEQKGTQSLLSGTSDFLGGALKTGSRFSSIYDGAPTDPNNKNGTAFDTSKKGRS